MHNILFICEIAHSKQICVKQTNRMYLTDFTIKKMYLTDSEI